jgi:hypothetical protein
MGRSCGVLEDSTVVVERGFVLPDGIIVFPASRDEAMISLMRLPGRSFSTVFVRTSLRFFGRENATLISSNPSCQRRCLLYRWRRVFRPGPWVLKRQWR